MYKGNKHKINFARIVKFLQTSGPQSTMQIYEYLCNNRHQMTRNELAKIMPKYFNKTDKIYYKSLGGYSSCYVWELKENNDYGGIINVD